MRTTEDIPVVVGKLGDEQSTLLDQFERRSFEVQLSRAMLGRSLSEPGKARSLVPPPQAAAVEAEVRRGARGSRLRRVLKRLLSPVFGKKRERREIEDDEDLAYLKAF